MLVTQDSVPAGIRKPTARVSPFTRSSSDRVVYSPPDSIQTTRKIAAPFRGVSTDWGSALVDAAGPTTGSVTVRLLQRGRGSARWSAALAASSSLAGGHSPAISTGPGSDHERLPQAWGKYPVAAPRKRCGGR